MPQYLLDTDTDPATITLVPPTPPPPPPSGVSITVDAVQMPEGNLNLRATGYDPEAGTHSFAWTCDRGYINTPAGDSCQWTASELDGIWLLLPSGTYTITLTVSLNSNVIGTASIAAILSREPSLRVE